MSIRESRAKKYEKNIFEHNSVKNYSENIVQIFLNRTNSMQSIHE